jgi:hypothetical protein
MDPADGSPTDDGAADNGATDDGAAEHQPTPLSIAPEPGDDDPA